MKQYKELEKKYSAEELAESFVFPNPSDKDERKRAMLLFKEFRKKRLAQQTLEEKQMIQVLQLKYLLEDYVNSNDYNEHLNFGYFLKEYITRLEKKNKEFAEEIDIDTSELSQIINRHRKPSEKILFRLEIHSNDNIPAIIWYKLMEKDKLHEIETDKQIRKEEKKHVKKKLPFSPNDF